MVKNPSLTLPLEKGEKIEGRDAAGIHALFDLARPTSLGTCPTSFQFLLSSPHPPDGLCYQIADDFRRLVPTEHDVELDRQHAELSPATGALAPDLLVNTPQTVPIGRFGMSSHGVPPFFCHGLGPSVEITEGDSKTKNCPQEEQFLIFYVSFFFKISSATLGLALP
jgi:hypothetical protein